MAAYLVDLASFQKKDYTPVQDLHVFMKHCIILMFRYWRLIIQVFTEPLINIACCKPI
jgi:hypothetical protein